MAMKQITKTCPHCGKVYEQRAFGAWGRKSTDEDRWVFGAPLKSCRYCNKLFIDKDYRELAITGPRSFDTERLTSSTRMLVIVGALLALLMGAFGQRTFAIVVIAVAAVYLFADLAFYPTRMKKLEKERQASETRLSDPAYARALKKAGYDIPKRYLKKESSEEE